MRFYEHVFKPSIKSLWRPYYLKYQTLVNLIDKEPTIDADTFDEVYVPEAGLINSSFPRSKFLEELDREIVKLDTFTNRETKALLLRFELLVRSCVLRDVVKSYTFSETLSSLLADVNTENDLLVTSYSNFPGSRTKVKKARLEAEFLGYQSNHSDEETQEINPSARYHDTEDEDKNRELEQLRFEFLDLHRLMSDMEQFYIVNSEAIMRLLHKFNRTTLEGTYPKDRPLHQMLRNSDIVVEMQQHQIITTLLREIERMFALGFFNGDNDLAMQQLRSKLRLNISRAIFIFGFASGISLGIMFFLVYVLAAYDFQSFPLFSSTITVYRMTGLLIFMLWCWGVNIYIWTKTNINYIFVLDLDPRGHIRFQHIFEAASVFTLVWTLSLSGYFVSSIKLEGFAGISAIPWQTYPLSLLAVFSLVFIIFQIRTRFWLIRTLRNVVITPFLGSTFRDVFLADQLVSMAIVLTDLEYVICFMCWEAWTPAAIGQCKSTATYLTPFISALPVTFRAVQCFRRYYDTKQKPNLVNAGKYCSTYLVIMFSTLRLEFTKVALVLWICSITFTTLYAYCWDVRMDWGLMNKDVPGAPFLRKQRVYQHKWVYYFAIMIDLALRCAWTLTLSRSMLELISPLTLSTTVAVLEIFRRSMWNVFRVENEQLVNVDRYRDINLIHAAPSSRPASKIEQI
eukprot:TRINITY_DN258_c0_g1_i1.p1 TRINITY_DN258_c0_g1~~TRINITY_DN258_c0_g1_i1.p1  ORF type:complete len:683 (+),score=111.49 TRINITY_DN258_c0_g1_i1:37-2085(+)